MLTGKWYGWHHGAWNVCIYLFVHSSFSFSSTVPPAPTDIIIQQQNSSWIITWSKVNDSLSSYGNVSGYIFFYKESFEPSSSYRGIATKEPLITLNDLKINTEYFFRILAYNDIGNGIPTQQYTFGTTQNNFKGRFSKPKFYHSHYKNTGLPGSLLFLSIQYMAPNM